MHLVDGGMKIIAIIFLLINRSFTPYNLILCAYVSEKRRSEKGFYPCYL